MIKVLKARHIIPSSISKRFISSTAQEYPPELIRNFSIIAHIDHGKSTLADRMLEITGVISKHSSNKQVLDKLKVERERGITVKAQTTAMFYEYNNKKYLLNLIDTPGHVDFSYEVSRSLAACQGTVLLVDACQGVQAQTVANFFLAFIQNLAILPVLNKIDLPNADPEKVSMQMQNVFEIESDEISGLSAKTGMGVSKLLDLIIERIPAPSGNPKGPFRAMLFDTWYDKYVGVVCLVAIKDGIVRKGDRIISAHSKLAYEVSDLGILHPEPLSQPYLSTGQVGYLTLNMKSTRDAFIGDTFYHSGVSLSEIEICPGFKSAKSMVFSGLYPIQNQDYPHLSDAIDRLTLNDSSVSVSKETSIALGQGFRLGFLGTLHLDVFRERLEEEYDACVISTLPTVPYLVRYKNGTEKFIQNPIDFPDISEHSKVEEFLEPMVKGTLIFPEQYLGALMELCGSRRGEQIDYSYLDESRIIMIYQLPMAEILTDFFDELKSKSSGYATFDYEEIPYRVSDLVKVNILLNGKTVDALSTVVHTSQSLEVAKEWVKKLKNVMTKQLFEVTIQAAVNNKIVARDTIKAVRKDVTAKCYGGDITRKMKLLDRQKEGKKKMKSVGGVELSQEAFYSMLGKDSKRKKSRLSLKYSKRNAQKQSLVRPVLFTLGFSISAFGILGYYRSQNQPPPLQIKWPQIRPWTKPLVEKDESFIQNIKDIISLNFKNQSNSQKLASAIIALNVGIFGLWQIPRLSAFMNRYFAHDPLSGRVFTIFSSNISHQGLMHLGFNMYALYGFLPLLQYKSGMSWEQTLAFYLTAGVVSTLGSHIISISLWTRGLRTVIPSLGASGGIWAVLLGSAFVDPDARVGIIFIPGVTFTMSELVPFMVLLDVIGLARGWQMFDHAAHLAGAAFGYLYLWKGRTLWNEFQTELAYRIK